VLERKSLPSWVALLFEGDSLLPQVKQILLSNAAVKEEDISSFEMATLKGDMSGFQNMRDCILKFKALFPQ
jgi:hypothetical protein